MILVDANVLVYAFRQDSERHEEYSSWLENELEAEAPFGFSEFVLSSFLRIVTHPRIFAQPTSAKDAFAFADAIRKTPNAIRLVPQ